MKNQKISTVFGITGRKPTVKHLSVCHYRFQFRREGKTSVYISALQTMLLVSKELLPFSLHNFLCGKERVFQRLKSFILVKQHFWSF